jgi:hypothetical protein
VSVAHNAANDVRSAALQALRVFARQLSLFPSLIQTYDHPDKVLLLEVSLRVIRKVSADPCEYACTCGYRSWSFDQAPLTTRYTPYPTPTTAYHPQVYLASKELLNLPDERYGSIETRELQSLLVAASTRPPLPAGTTLVSLFCSALARPAASSAALHLCVRARVRARFAVRQRTPAMHTRAGG